MAHLCREWISWKLEVVEVFMMFSEFGSVGLNFDFCFSLCLKPGNGEVLLASESIRNNSESF